MNISDVAKNDCLKMAMPDEQERRLSICRECEHLFKIPVNFVTGTCKKCGCFMDVKVKFASASCPVGKW